jgi:VanZ family protein
MALAIAAIVVLIGALDELHQAGLPGRTADAMDFFADTCAVAFTIGSLSAWTKLRAPRGGANPRRDSCVA